MRGLLIGALVMFTLAACGGEEQAPEEPAAPDPCVESMRTAAAEKDSTKAEPLIAATLDACSTGDEWLNALREHPGAMGLTERATIDESSAEIACYAYPDTAVCRDIAGN
jgi:hypothetical protein